MLFAGSSLPAAAAAQVDAQMRAAGFVQGQDGAWRSPADLLNDAERARRAAAAVAPAPGTVVDFNYPVMDTGAPGTSAQPFNVAVYEQPATPPSDDTAAFDLLSERNEYGETNPRGNSGGTGQGTGKARGKPRRKARKKVRAKKAPGKKVKARRGKARTKKAPAKKAKARRKKARS